jgi:hypothetical protein
MIPRRAPRGAPYHSGIAQECGTRRRSQHPARSPKTKRCIIGDAARHTRPEFVDQLNPALGFRKRDRLTAVGILALGDALFVAEGIGDGFRDRLTAVGIVALGDGPLITEGIGGGGLRDAASLCRSSSSTRERDRQSGGKNCKSFHDTLLSVVARSPKAR